MIRFCVGNDIDIMTSGVVYHLLLIALHILSAHDFGRHF